MATNLPAVTGDEVQAEDVNRYSGIIEQTAGETINGATLPVACFFQDSDNEWYACDGNDDTKLEFQGFAITNGTNGNSITIQSHGIVDGFTGLTEGSKYYVQDDQTIGTSIGTYEILVGIAISATEIFIQKGSMEYCGSAVDSADVITSPSVARYAIIAISFTNGVGTSRGEIFLNRHGKTTGTLTDWQGAGSQVTGTASWSSESITLTSTGGTGNLVTGTGYFYR